MDEVLADRLLHFSNLINFMGLQFICYGAVAVDMLRLFVQSSKNVD